MPYQITVCQSNLNCYKKTADIEQVKKWIEERGGTPAVVKDTDILEFILPCTSCDQSEEDPLEIINWSDFETLFSQSHCIFLYEDDSKSCYYKVIENVNF